MAAATPFILIILAWPAISNRVIGDPYRKDLTAVEQQRLLRRAAGLRTIWAFFVFFFMFASVHAFALRAFATTDDQTFYYSQAVRNMLTEVSKPDVCGRRRARRGLWSMQPPASDRVAPQISFFFNCDLQQGVDTACTKQFYDIRDVEDFWDFLEGPFTTAMFPATTEFGEHREREREYRS